ncbi:JmjC domain-containing protein [Glaciecola petra]|uniref:Cupin domain-containing protein n=1 Tax=Glaciecola petra TaxID=3075602 RepID=A0ABU2ZY01_9ALTE|nr:cupin domain-containing protein [Aestuariibacter sp. P117]MDT0596287.1 cupin domain-containing protein [Aestuariibacter sp. P117]
MKNNMYVLTEFNSAHFLQEFWQKKPCVIKQFIGNFEDPIDEHDLAGLAQENGVDSRIVSKNIQADGSTDWSVEQGPFVDYSEICKGAWSLLVQGVDKCIPVIEELTESVAFIPYWRMDDVMVSFSTAQAGVGPHIDEYDVFIVQGKGSRRWQVGLPSENEQENLMPHPLLKQIKGFVPVIDEILAPGDAVYIPPKHPHNGLALENCLNYSIGFRAPTDLEVLTALLDEEDLSGEQTRYSDPNLSTLRSIDAPSGLVSNSEVLRIKQLIVNRLSSDTLDNILLKSLSRQQLPYIEASTEYLMHDLILLCQQDTIIERMPGVRPLYSEQLREEGFTFFIDGHSFCVEKTLRAKAQALLEHKYTKMNLDSDNSNDKQEWHNLLLELINLGYWQPILD